MSQDNNRYLRDLVLFIINIIQANQLFVHSDKLKVKTKKGEVTLPKILTLTILNALVPNSAMLLIGGHGGGKTSLVKFLGRMFTGMSLSETEDTILRGHPQLTEEKIIATMDFAKLMREGKEEIRWRTFAKSFWKIIDEVNRCSPYIQNILLSLLAEGKIKYYDEVLHIHKYCLYATLNPQDVGTFELSAPFLDRFGISVAITMPKSQDLAVILNTSDEKLGGFDEITQIPEVLSEEDVLTIWYLVSNVPCEQDASDYIQAIIREFTLCKRVDKGNSSELKPETGLCTGCHYFIPQQIPCSNVNTILSVRVAKDLLRYSRALAWLLGEEKVTVSIVNAIAPYVIAHRVEYVSKYVNKQPYWGNKYAFTEFLIKQIQKRFLIRKKAYERMRQFKQGKATRDDLSLLKEMARVDLIVEQDLYPAAKELLNSDYKKMIKNIEKAQMKGDIKAVSELRDTLFSNINFPNRGYLITQINKVLKELTFHAYNCTMQDWKLIRFFFAEQIPEFSKKLDKTTRQRGTYRFRNKNLELEVNITGTMDESIVNFSFYGNEIAEEINRRLLKEYKNAFKSAQEILQEAEKQKQLKMEELRKELDDVSDVEIEDLLSEFDDDEVLKID